MLKLLNLEYFDDRGHDGAKFLMRELKQTQAMWLFRNLVQAWFWISNEVRTKTKGMNRIKVMPLTHAY